jgi:hypothetical protein
MNQNLDEQKIKQLFRDARRADEHAAPSFTATLAAAMMRAERREPGAWFLRVAVTTVALVVISVSALFIFRQSATPPKVDPEAHAGGIITLPYDHSRESVDPERKDSIVPFSPIPPEFTPKHAGLRSPRRRPRVTPPHQSFVPSATLISQWQSPTDFLLTIPGEQLLKTVPRLRESSIEFKTILPDEKN